MHYIYDSNKIVITKTVLLYIETQGDFMNSKLKKISIILAITGIIALILLSGLINQIARKRFRTQSYDDMEMTARVKIANFETSMNEQLTLVLQMMKMPSIKAYLINPDDEAIREAAIKDLLTFKDSFSGRYLQI